MQGNRAEIVDSCLRNSRIWRDLKVRSLTKNMRAAAAAGAVQAEMERFSDFLLSVGEGAPADVHIREGLGADWIKVPEEIAMNGGSLGDLLDEIFPNMQDNMANRAWLMERAVLCTKNTTADEVNSVMCDRMTWAEGTELLSCDTATCDNNDSTYPDEYLNSLNPSGMPPHKLILKPGMPVMLLRNLNPLGGDCNGTRYGPRTPSTHDRVGCDLTGRAGWCVGGWCGWRCDGQVHGSQRSKQVFGTPDN